MSVVSSGLACLLSFGLALAGATLWASLWATLWTPKPSGSGSRSPASRRAVSPVSPAAPVPPLGGMGLMAGLGVIGGWALGRGAGGWGGAVDWAILAAGLVVLASPAVDPPWPRKTAPARRRARASPSSPSLPRASRGASWVAFLVVVLAAVVVAGGPGDAFHPRSWSLRAGAAAGLGVVWLGVAWRLRPGPTTVPRAGPLGAAFGLAGVAWVVDRGDVVLPALSLGAALTAIFLVQTVARRPEAPSLCLTGVGFVMALAATLAVGEPEILAGIGVVFLSLFADDSALNATARASRPVQVLAALAAALAPVGVAGALAVVGAGMPPG